MEQKQALNKDTIGENKSFSSRIFSKDYGKYDYEITMKPIRRLLILYDKILHAWMRGFGFASGPSLTILLFSFLEVFFAYGFARGVLHGIRPHFIKPLLFALGFVMIFHSWLYGVLSKIKLNSPFKVVRRLNAFYPNGILRENLSLSDTRKILRDLTKFTRLKLITSFLDVLLMLLIMEIYNFVYLNGEYTSSFILVAVVATALHAQFTYTTTDLHLMQYRAVLTEKLFSHGIFRPIYPSLSLKVKFVFVVLSIALSGYILLSLMSGELAASKHGFFFVILFSIYCLFLIILLSVLYFSNIFVAVKGLENTAEKLKQGQKVSFHTSSSDKELLALSSVFFEAAYQIEKQKEILEETVKERTAELELANEELKLREKEVNNELDFASDIQRGMLPDLARPWDGISFSGFFMPMGKVSGDYYDIFRDEDHLYVLLADASGHGIPAAFLTIAAKQSFMKAFENNLPPAMVFEEVNLEILHRVQTQDYLTAFLLKFDEQYRFQYANAAHHPAIHFRSKLGKYVEYDTAGYILGAIEEASNSYENKSARLTGGDRIFLYTDGLIEQENEAGEPFSKSRLMEILKKSEGLTLDDLSKNLQNQFLKFKGEVPLSDDVTFLCLELSPKWNLFAKRFNEGYRLYKQKKYNEALPALEDAAGILPRYPFVHLLLAKTYTRLKAYRKAASEIEIFLSTHKRNVNGLKLAAKIYYHEGRLVEAVEHARRLKSIEDTPENAKFLHILEQKLLRTM